MLRNRRTRHVETVGFGNLPRIEYFGHHRVAPLSGGVPESPTRPCTNFDKNASSLC